MIEDLRPQPDQAAVNLGLSWPRYPSLQSDEELSVDLEVDTSVFRLLDLPTELITMIFASLVPAPLPTGTRRPPRDILDSRNALAKLCLTSKVCRDIALPLLYCNIIITSRKQMASLFVNLITRQDRCAWMRSFAVLADLTFHHVSDKDERGIVTRSRRLLETHKIQNQTKLVSRTIDEARWFIYRLFENIRSPFFLPMFHHRMLRIILYLGTRIEDILVTAPFSLKLLDLSHHRKILVEDLNAMTGRQFPCPCSDQAEFGDTFKSLRRIRTQADPTKRSVCAEPNPLGLEFIKCQEWEFFRDSGRWMALFPRDAAPALRREPSKYLEIFSHVTELRLYESRTHPAWLCRCLRYAKNLKVFCYTTEARDWNHRFPNSALTAVELGATLQQALEEVRDTLTDLRLGWVKSAPWRADLTEEEEAAVAPHRVDVSRFPRLKTIEIDPPFLHHEDEEQNKDGGGGDYAE